MITLPNRRGEKLQRPAIVLEWRSLFDTIRTVQFE
jgi:hypothetical protein